MSKEFIVKYEQRIAILVTDNSIKERAQLHLLESLDTVKKINKELELLLRQKTKGKVRLSMSIVDGEQTSTLIV